jgi:hypothetical protein
VSGAPAFDNNCVDAGGQTYHLPTCQTIAFAQYEAQYGYPFVADGIITPVINLPPLLPAQ